MTTLIYRGVKHDGQRTIRPRTAQALIYRGVAHDGLSPAPEAPSRPVAMRYRGVAYSLAPRAPLADMRRVQPVLERDAHAGVAAGA